MSIYGNQKDKMNQVMLNMVHLIETISNHNQIIEGEPLYEHLNYRIKNEESMKEKCHRKNLPETMESALEIIHDAIGIRIVTSFVEDIYKIRETFINHPEIKIIKEKDYIKKNKENGYRSYHMIVYFQGYYIEIQLRTIAMDSWAALEHQLSYKKTIDKKELIQKELKRVADELASCDLSMQTIRHLIKEKEL